MSLEKFKDPITSYGIVLFYLDENGVIWYLLAQRRDSIEYVNYVRGIYSHANLNMYFKLMTPDERHRLRNYTFDELWDDLWINHDNRFYRDGKEKAKLKFQANLKEMHKLLSNTVSFREEPSWCFPKGRKNNWENEVECAFREFREETRLTIDYLNLINILPSREVFRGSNGKVYSTVYYIARVDKRLVTQKLVVNNGLRDNTVSEEISNLKWITLIEALKILPPWRQNLLLEVDTNIKNFLKKNN